MTGYAIVTDTGHKLQAVGHGSQFRWVTRSCVTLLDPLPALIGTLAVDGWAVTFSTARRGLGGLRPAQAPPRCTNVTAHPSTATIPTSYYSMCTIIASEF